MKVDQLRHQPKAAAVKSALGDRVLGVEERLGWDTIDEISARMHGFRTRTLESLVAIHHRSWGSAEGVLRGRARHGCCYYINHYPLWWVTLRALKTAAAPPRGLSGVVFLWGYLRAAAARDPRVEDPEFRAWMHRELTARAAGALGLRPLAERVAPRIG